MKQILLVLFFICTSQVIYSQFTYRTVETIYIEYNGKKYTMPRGIKQFMQDAPMDNELRTELNRQHKIIKKKQSTFYIVAFGGTAIGGTIFLTSLAKAGENNESFPVTNVAIGGGIILGSAITGILLKAKKSDYRKFVNTYNAHQNKKRKIKTDFSINLSKDNTGLGICFNF